MVKLVSKIISKIKHREYIIDENITDNDLFSIVFTRFYLSEKKYVLNQKVILSAAPV